MIQYFINPSTKVVTFIGETPGDTLSVSMFNVALLALRSLEKAQELENSMANDRLQYITYQNNDAISDSSIVVNKGIDSVQLKYSSNSTGAVDVTFQGAAGGRALAGFIGTIEGGVSDSDISATIQEIRHRILGLDSMINSQFLGVHSHITYSADRAAVVSYAQHRITHVCLKDLMERGLLSKALSKHTFDKLVGKLAMGAGPAIETTSLISPENKRAITMARTVSIGG